ncbi:hypothetical protein GGR58DRAFT_380186 [Xylaria digitata]|nr:hypothetical protein GGR58DRAFT_380186 [Xylaria digitata]
MRLLQRQDNGSFTLTKNLIDNIPPYAILSHTWGEDDEEVVFNDIVESISQQKYGYQQKPGYRKIDFCAKWAAADRLQYFWIDSCCIDKSNSTELQEAITSMFRWYRNAAKCYVYLSDVIGNKEQHQETLLQPAWESAFRKSRWFTRGWTLQELLAPRCVEFFSKDGYKLGSRPVLNQLLQEVTGIAIDALHGETLSEFSISERMSWSRGRETKRKEDKAYSLLGIFDVSIFVNYGEGEERAMDRLRAEIERRWGSQRAAYAKEFPSFVHTIGTEATPTREVVRERRRLLMDSLSFEKIDARHSNIKSAYGKTCVWLLSHPDYVKWLTPAEFPQHHGLLWIHGKPGAGKSTVMKFIYTRALGNSDTTISFFFNARGDILEKSTQGMYRSLLLQLLEKLQDLQEVLDLPGRFGQGHNDDSTWEINVLQSLFSAAIAKLGRRRVTCFVDALDECGESQVRDMVEYFEQLGQSALDSEGKLYICFSSRHYPTICIQHGQTLTLEDQPGHSQDLEKYVRSKLQAGKGRDVESVRTELLQKAAGVFMWVVLVVTILNEEFQRGRIFAVKRRLQETPAELSELFKDILRRDKKNMADLLLSIQWILYAKRPMKPEEFYYAVVAGLDPTQENLAEWDPENITADDMNRFVCSSSKGLAEITKSKARTVQFIHESVRDFLLKDGGIHDLWPNLGANFQSLSHDQLKQCCYKYLLTDISNRITDNQELPKASSDGAKILRQQVSRKFPFLEYATHQVLYHANIAAIELPQHDFLNSFDLRAWVHLDNLFAKFGTRRHTLAASLPYILAENNFARLIDGISWHDTQVYNHEERHVYPLFAALANGHREAVRALLQLQNGLVDSDRIIAKISYGKDLKVRKGQTPLCWAAENGHQEIIRLLIEKSANVELKDSSGQTPLSWAVENRHQEIVQLLIQKGADVESKDSSGRTLLLRAAQNEWKYDTFELNDENSRGLFQANHTLRDYQIQLMHLEQQNKKRLLLSRGPIDQAGTIRLLLNKGANIKSKDSSSRTALSWAAEKGHQEIVQLLIEKGADVDEKDSSSRTPLSWATQNGHQKIVQLLVEKGADVDEKDSSG